MGKLAAVMDVGTNSVRMLVARCESDSLAIVHRALQIARIGEGVNSTGLLGETAMQRALDVLGVNLAKARELGAEVLAVVATSAVRDAENSDQFVRKCAQIGIELEIIGGEEEARLSYLGAVKGLSVAESAKVSVIDIGGGSTEVVNGQGAAIENRYSADVGGVRMTERYLGDTVNDCIDLKGERWQLLRQDVAANVSEINERLGGISERSLIGTGGTATTLAAVSQGLVQYDANRVHGYKLTRTEITEILERLAAVPLHERRNMAGLQPERADIILAGTEILRQLVCVANEATVIISDSDLLQALLYERC